MTEIQTTDSSAADNSAADNSAADNSGAGSVVTGSVAASTPAASNTTADTRTADRAAGREVAQHDTVASIRGLSKHYGSHHAVESVSFDIRRGETVALLGPNGAGKSTTIEILTGYRSRSGGEVDVLGSDPARGGLAWRSRLGIVLQSSGESGNVTVREPLREFAGYYPNPRDVGDVIDAVGLTAKRDARIGKLSGGQRRRVDVALGIIGRPELLFLDEPTTGFDPEARHRFWELIHALRDDGTSILLTTHYLDEAARLSDRAAVIAGGRLVDIGPVDEIGGPEARVPIVRWTDAEGRHCEERTDEPGRRVAALTAETGTEPRGLEVLRPTLEDIYLGLIRATETLSDHRREGTE